VAPFDYTTPASVFAYGNSAGTGTTPVNEAAVMAQLVTGMSRALDQYCNQAFSVATYTAQVLRGIVDLDGVLTAWPAVPTISSITAAAFRVGNSAAWQELTASDLDIEEHGFGCEVRLLGRDLSSYRGGRIQVRLSYTGGWANLSAVPSDFEWATRALCWWAYQKRSAPIDKTAYPDMGMVVVPSNWPTHLKQMFRNYVRQVVV
jgi:hypothetical protein